MPRPRDPAGYPTVYGEVIETVSSTGVDFVHKCKDAAAAKLLRFEFYDYIKALRKSPSARYKLMGEQASGLMFCVKGAELIIKLRDMQDKAMELGQSLTRYQEEVPSFAQAPQVPVASPQPTAPSQQALGNSLSQDDLVADFMRQAQDSRPKK